MRNPLLLLWLAVIAAALSSHHCYAVESDALIGRPITELNLQDFRGKHWSLVDFKDRRVVVVAFLGVECPLAKLYAGRLQQLANDYRDRGVAVIGVNANRQDSITELAAFARQHAIEFPLLKDPGNIVADAFGARRTPEVFVLDAERKIRYHGRVDDQYGIGFVRDEPQRRDLQIAIDELLAGEAVSEPTTIAPGCYIGRAKQPLIGATVTYSNQIARILQARCVECHRPGDIAPFSLMKYDEVAGWAETIAEVVSEERMPPWHASPKHGKFAGDRRLSDQEKSLISQWVKAGAPEGDPAELPPEPKFATTGWQLPQEPDLVVPMSEKPFVVPATGTIKYQFFTADPGLTEDKWVRAIEVRPGNRAVVHHVLVFAATGNARERIEEGGTNGFFAAYVPGLRAAEYPSGMARRLPAGSRLVFQLHYTPNGSPQMDLSEVGMVFAEPDSITQEIRTVSAVQRKIEIPPHADNHMLEATSASATPGTRLMAFMPHMHLRGKAFSYEAIFADGQRELLLDIPRYDFNWQTRYVLAEPREVPPGTRLHAVAHYDNSGQNLNNPDPSKTIRWGSQTWEEMMIGYFEIAVPRDAKRDSVSNGGSDADASAKRERIKRFVEQLDKNGDGRVTRDEVPELLRPQFDRLSTDGRPLAVELIRRVLERRE
jgi:peroxiredoxin